MSTEDTPRVLVVDDNYAQRLSIRAVLADVDVEIVEAPSGREALRLLLRQEFAVILLDVHMPGLDGLETAALIRARPSCEQTPIILVTAYSDESHASRGYSLGVVDYIMTPVQPEVLRTKVSVFIDLFRKTEQIKRQREALARHAAQLRQLSRAALAISAAQTVEDVVDITAAQAAEIIGAHQALAVAAVADSSTCVSARHVSDKYAGREDHASPAQRDQGRPRYVPQAVRMTADALARASVSETVPRSLIGDLPMSGWLAAPLLTRTGDSIGTLELSEKRAGEFTAEDEDILVQLAQIASVAIDNILAAEAREANRLKDEFLGVLSHELRTPLQAILTWAAILQRDSLDASTKTRALEVIERSARAQTQLIEDLLDVSRIIRGQLRLDLGAVSVPHVVELAVEALKPAAAAKSIRIDVGTPDGASGDARCEVVGDASRLQQVILNLLSNAVKFTPERGTVEVSLAAEPSRIVVRVRDSGPGIPADFLPHVFERFRQADSTTRRRHGGLGLGLAIVRSLVELHGGDVRAENLDGEGACFTVVLPRGSLAAHESGRVPAEEGGEPPALDGTRLDGIRVVLVEDEAEARESLTAALQLSGASVVAVSSAEEALEVLSRNGAHNGSGAHVLLSDIGLPRTDGYELIRRVRAREAQSGGRIPAAALTAYVRAEDRATALRAGFDAHVKKPVDPERLARVVRRLAEQRTRS